MILLAIFLGLLGLYLYKRHRHMSILARNGIPGPVPNLFAGNMLDFFSSPNVPKVSEYFKKYGPIVGYYIGRRPMVLINDLELIRRVQVKDFSNFPDRQQPNVKYGLHPNPHYYLHLISARGSHWKQLRTILNPTFSALKLKTMTPIFDNSIDILLEKVGQRSKEGKEFDIYEYFQLLTTDVITKCALGIDTNVQQNPNDEFLQAGRKVFNGPSKFLMLFTWLPELDLFLYPLRRLYQIWKESRDLSPQAHIAKLVKTAIALRGQSPSGEGQKGYKSSKPKHDLLQLMLDAKATESEIQNTADLNLSIDMHVENDSDVVAQNGGVQNGAQNGGAQNGVQKGQTNALTLNEVISTAVIFYEAGFETTSTALGFVAHVLVTKPDIQEKVREEVRELYKTEGKFDYNTVSKLTYMQCVINETMRYYPPVTMFATRTANEDYPYGDITIPKGATVQIPIHQLHHNEKFWPNHTHFDPERFRDKSAIDTIAFQPFGNGPRNCIGMRFALYEMKLALAKLLFSYRLVKGPSTEEELSIDYKIITETPKNGVWVKAVKVE